MRGIVDTSRASVVIDYSSARRVLVRACTTCPPGTLAVRVRVLVSRELLWLLGPQRRAERAWGEAGPLAMALAPQSLGLLELAP